MNDLTKSERTMTTRSRINFLAATLALSFVTCRTQAQSFKEGDNFLSAGYGVGTLLGSVSTNFDNYGQLEYKGTGPIYLKFEHGVSENIGLGLNLAYAMNQWDYTYQLDSTTYAETTKRTT